MTKEEIRSRIIEMASNSTGIIVSIPESMAMVGGDMYALQMVDTAKERLPKKENPMRSDLLFSEMKYLLLPMETLNDYLRIPITWKSSSRWQFSSVQLGMFVYIIKVILF